jgi:formate-dependent phosphoribosylglycinamide formyltransferase (GAR transformylase)
MDVLFLSPAYPPEMHQFTRGLAEVGARVLGVGDTPRESLPASLRGHLADYLVVPSMGDEADTERRIVAWLGGRQPDRIEGIWEPVTMMAARLRERLGVGGMSVDRVRGFRDKPLMRERVAAAGLRVPRTARVRSRDEVWAMAETIGFPLILKPVDGAGSADTWRVDGPEQLDQVLGRIGHLSEASCEEFIQGDEYTYETLCVDGHPVYESVCRYEPNTLVARQNEWISAIIQTMRDMGSPTIAPGIALGRAVLQALGMGTGFTHMEWFLHPDGTAVFGEIACRPPGANMVDLMNYTEDLDLYRGWARIASGQPFGEVVTRPWSAAIVFKRAVGKGRILAHDGLREFVARHHPSIARIDLLPIGAPRRDWKQTFLSDGNLVVRHPDQAEATEIAREAAARIRLRAG